MDIESTQIDTTLLNRRNRDLRTMKSLRIGAGNTLIGADVRGFWIGGKTPEEAPFSVDMHGTVLGINLDGSIITGATVRTNATGTRVELNGTSNKLSVYENGYERTSLDAGGIKIFTETGLQAGTISGIDNSGYKKLQITSGVGNALFTSWENPNDYLASMYAIGGGEIKVEGDGTTGGSCGLYGWVADANLTIQTIPDGLGGIISYLVATTDLVPITNPGGTGRIWNDGGTLKIT